MAHERPHILSLETPAQAKALSSPLRLELVEAFQVRGPSSVRELAGDLGRPPDSLYYHVKQLLSAGVVVVDETRTGSRRGEAVYTLVAPEIEIAWRPGSATNRDAWRRAGAAILRRAERDFCASIESREAAVEGPARDTEIRRVKARLDERGLTELNQRIADLLDFLRREGQGGAGKLVALTVALAPLEKES